MSAIIAQATSASWGTGLEFMLVLSIVLPVLLLVAILWLGHRNTV